MDDYVSITSFSNHEFNKPCMLEIPDNWAWGESYNVPLEDLVTVTIDALNKGYTLAWGPMFRKKDLVLKMVLLWFLRIQQRLKSKEKITEILMMLARIGWVMLFIPSKRNENHARG